MIEFRFVWMRLGCRSDDHENNWISTCNDQLDDILRDGSHATVTHHERVCMDRVWIRSDELSMLIVKIIKLTVENNLTNSSHKISLDECKRQLHVERIYWPICEGNDHKTRILMNLNKYTIK